MASKQVNWSVNALQMVFDILDYLSAQTDDQKASDYITDLLDFGNDLDKKSEHYSFCRHPKLQAKSYRCALFRKAYVVIFKEDSTSVNILAVIHAKRSPDVFAAV